MSFSSDIKNEIMENRQVRSRHMKAMAYGLFLFGRHFDGDKIMLVTENEDVFKLFLSVLSQILGSDGTISRKKKKGPGKVAFSCVIEDKADIQKILCHFRHETGINLDIISTPDETAAFISGAFLACGNMTDPIKSYQLEFVARSSALCAELADILDETIPGVKVVARRGLSVAYYKECSQIEDVLTLMGASRASLSMIDVEMIKEVRNRANRVTNCETANIDKLVGAATAQVEDINLIIAEKGLDSLPDNLKTAAVLRLENPELSLRELSVLMTEPISRSGMHHRLEKISRIAASIRGENHINQ